MAGHAGKVGVLTELSATVAVQVAAGVFIGYYALSASGAACAFAVPSPLFYAPDLALSLAFFCAGMAAVMRSRALSRGGADKNRSYPPATLGVILLVGGLVVVLVVASGSGALCFLWPFHT